VGLLKSEKQTRANPSNPSRRASCSSAQVVSPLIGGQLEQSSKWGISGRSGPKSNPSSSGRKAGAASPLFRRLTADLSDHWQCEFDAEAARLEFEEGLPRLQAEELARQWITLRRGHVAGLCTAIMPAAAPAGRPSSSALPDSKGGRGGQIIMGFRGVNRAGGTERFFSQAGILILFQTRRFCP